MLVYKATLPNGKSYIGVTKFKLSDRIKGHKCSVFTKNSQNPFHKACRKYGWENVIWDILFEGNDYQDLLNKEIELISKLNTLVPNGYNVTMGGEGTLGSKHNLGKKHSEEFKRHCKAEGMKTAKKCVVIDCDKKTITHFDSLAEVAKTYNLIYDSVKTAARRKAALYQYKILHLKHFNPNDIGIFHIPKASNAKEFEITNGSEILKMNSINDLIKFLNIKERQARKVFYNNLEINGWRKI